MTVQVYFFFIINVLRDTDEWPWKFNGIDKMKNCVCKQ